MSIAVPVLRFVVLGIGAIEFILSLFYAVFALLLGTSLPWSPEFTALLFGIIGMTAIAANAISTALFSPTTVRLAVSGLALLVYPPMLDLLATHA